MGWTADESFRQDPAMRESGDEDEAWTEIFDGEGAWLKKERIGQSNRSWSSKTGWKLAAEETLMIPAKIYLPCLWTLLNQNKRLPIELDSQIMKELHV